MTAKVKLGNWLGLRCFLEMCPTQRDETKEWCRICGKDIAYRQGTMITKEGKEFELWIKV